MAKSGGTLPGERRRAGRGEQVAVAGRPTGQPHCKANFPRATQLGWSPFEAFSNGFTRGNVTVGGERWCNVSV